MYWLLAVHFWPETFPHELNFQRMQKIKKIYLSSHSNWIKLAIKAKSERELAKEASDGEGRGAIGVWTGQAHAA